MSRVTAPVAKLSRSINSASAGRGLLDTHNSHGAVIMPKYAELLKKKTSTDVDSQSRGIKTTHRPTPQPKPSKFHARPLMQTFSSTSVTAAASSTIDATVMPALTPSGIAEADLSTFRMPLLPDSFATRHVMADTPDAPLATPEISVVAAQPGDVLPVSAFTEVEGMGVDGVELRFAHEDARAAGEEDGPGMLTDLWRGLVDDITGRTPKMA